MKRSYFKRKPTKHLKRTPLKKKSKAKISTIQNRLWEIIKKIIRQKYPPICYTCGATSLKGSNLQTGHMWAKSSLGAYLKYDLRILRIQCFSCNIWQGGRGADFYSRMLKEIGQEAMERLEKDRQVTVNAYSHYEHLLKEYQEILCRLQKDTKTL